MLIRGRPLPAGTAPAASGPGVRARGAGREARAEVRRSEEDGARKLTGARK